MLCVRKHQVLCIWVHVRSYCRELNVGTFITCSFVLVSIMNGVLFVTIEWLCFASIAQTISYIDLIFIFCYS